MSGRANRDRKMTHARLYPNVKPQQPEVDEAIQTLGCAKEGVWWSQNVGPSKPNPHAPAHLRTSFISLAILDPVALRAPRLSERCVR